MTVLQEKIKSKTLLRQNALKKREFFADSGMLKKNSSLIVSKILNSELFASCKHVGLYFPIKNEVNLLPLLKVKDKKFYFPACVNNNLEFRLFGGFENLKKGAFNIYESVLAPVEPEVLDLIFVPALLANSRFYRLGYGKGFYDRYFSKNNVKAKKIIVVQNAFVCDDFIEDSSDVQCDYILSES